MYATSYTPFHSPTSSWSILFFAASKFLFSHNLTFSTIHSSTWSNATPLPLSFPFSTSPTSQKYLSIKMIKVTPLPTYHFGPKLQEILINILYVLLQVTSIKHLFSSHKIFTWTLSSVTYAPIKVPLSFHFSFTLLLPFDLTYSVIPL